MIRGLSTRDPILPVRHIDVGVISMALGHSHVSTTSIYLDHISPKLVIDTLRNRTWGGVEAVGAR